MRNYFLFYLLTFLLSFSLFAEEVETELEKSSYAIHGFFDTNAGYIDSQNKTKLTSSTLNIFLTNSFTDRINMLIDVALEVENSHTKVDLERLKFTYSANEYLDIMAGEFHIPYGYWSTAVHHGIQLQTSILRPKFLALEYTGGILPASGIGGLAQINIDDFEYTFYVASGMFIEKIPVNGIQVGRLTINTNIANTNPLLGVNLGYNIEETKIGLHGFVTDVDILSQQRSHVKMFGAYIIHEGENFELNSEVYLFLNTNDTGPFANDALFSEAYFLQVAYTLGDVKPYARYEYARYNPQDFYFVSQAESSGGSYERVAIGLNYSLFDDTNIKIAVLRHEEQLSKLVTHDVLIQLALSF